MTAGLKHALVGILIGIVYWSAFSALVATNEPWDGAYYWSAAYPGSMILAIALGFVFRRRAWITGLSLTFAQLPIMLANTGIGSLVVFAVVLLGILSIPLILAAAMTSICQSSATA